MTRKEQVSNGFTEMMRGLWNNQDLKVPDIETLKSKMTLEEHTSCKQEPCDAISRQAAIDEIKEIYEWHDNVTKERIIEHFVRLPSAQPETEWNNHTVACLLAELFGDACACNYNGIDEWLPEKCEVIDACTNPVGVACWEQFLKHRAGRRTDGKNT